MFLIYYLYMDLTLMGFFNEFLKKVFQKSAWCYYVSITVFSIKRAQEERNFKFFTVLFIFHPKDSNPSSLAKGYDSGPPSLQRT